MSQINRELVKQLRREIDSALSVVATKHNLEMSLGTISFTNTQFGGKLTVISKSATPETEEGFSNSKWKAAFLKNCRLYGFKAEDFGREVLIGTAVHRIAGMRPRAQEVMVLQKPSGSYIAYDHKSLKAALELMEA